jgi:hypothetical protein
MSAAGQSKPVAPRMVLTNTMQAQPNPMVCPILVRIASLGNNRAAVTHPAAPSRAFERSQKMATM